MNEPSYVALWQRKWRIRTNQVFRELHKDLDRASDIKKKRL